MNIRVRSQQDFAAGLFFVAIALGALWIGWGYPTGTAVRMSAGYFPRRLVARHIASGRLREVRAPAFRLPAYLVYPLEHDRSLFDPALQVIRRVAAAGHS